MEHLDKKTDCSVQKAFACECGKSYSQAHGLSRHKKTCISTLDQDAVILQQIAALQQQLSVQPSTSTHISVDNSTSNTNTNTNTNITNTTNNITVNVQVNNMGQEFQDHLIRLDYKELKKILKLTPDHESLMAMIRFIHLNDEHPENRNVKINASDNLADVRRKGRWVKEDSDIAIYDLISRNCLRFIDVTETLEKGMQKAKHDALTEYLELAEDMANKENMGLHADKFEFKQLLERAKAAFILQA